MNMPSSAIFSTEASAVDLRVYDQLKDLYWKLEDTMFYQPSYALSEEEQKQFPGSKSIKPDFVLQDLQGSPIAVIEDKLDDAKRALAKLRLKYSTVLRPRFLYACALGSDGQSLSILYYDMMWRGVDAGEFRKTENFMSLEDMKRLVDQHKQRQREQEITIDTSIAGGFDASIGKDRYYHGECIRTLIESFRNGKTKMLVHMATGMGKTRMAVALVKALFQFGFAKKVLFVVDRRFLARQAIQKGFSLISPTYNASWITSSNFKAHKNKDIQVVVIDTLEILFSKIPSNYYDLIIVDECHRSITINRKIIFDHFICPRIGLTATPRIGKPPAGVQVSEEDLAIMDTYRLFGCETKKPDYEFDLDRGIREGFLAPYGKEEIITELTRQAMASGIKYDHLLDPEDREKIINLPREQQIELEQLNKKILSQEQADRWAEEIRKKTQFGEKVIVFGASQAHCIMLAEALNKVFDDSRQESPHYAEAIISEYDDLNYALKEWFDKPYQNPRIVVSVDIMSTGVDIPCVRYIAFCALTRSVGKYTQMVGRGTRLDPKTGKFSFTLLDFVGLCKKMQDNGRGTPRDNETTSPPGQGGGSSGGGGGNGGIHIDGILDNPDPAHMIQRVTLTDSGMKIIDNIPIEKARELFEQGVKSVTRPLIAELKRKAWENKDYEPTEEDLAAIKRWINDPEMYLTEENLQRIYDFPGGSAWDFFLNVLGVKKIPTTTERIEQGFDAYLDLYNFSTDQKDILEAIKDVFVANISSHGKIDVDMIFANPVYSHLIGEFEEVNRKFDGKLREIIAEIETTFKKAA